MAYQRNPIKNAPSVPYDGRPIEPINKMHWQQQIHKYNVGLFVTGIVAMASALISIILLSIVLVRNTQDDLTKSLAAGASSSTLVFVITLGIDVILTVLLNKYYKNKLPLILFIPALALMVIFCVPQLLSLLQLFNIKVSIPDFTGVWSSYVVIAICSAFIILELLRMIIHRDDLNIYAEVKKALR